MQKSFDTVFAFDILYKYIHVCILRHNWHYGSPNVIGTNLFLCRKPKYYEQALRNIISLYEFWMLSPKIAIERNRYRKCTGSVTEMLIRNVYPYYGSWIDFMYFCLFWKLHKKWLYTATFLILDYISYRTRQLLHLIPLNNVTSKSSHFKLFLRRLPYLVLISIATCYISWGEKTREIRWKDRTPLYICHFKITRLRKVYLYYIFNTGEVAKRVVITSHWRYKWLHWA